MELLSARGVTKYFPETGTLANDGVSLALQAGEIRALVGENGAGKSTLARILAGLALPDSGEIRLRGRPARFTGARDAERAGVGLVPQHSFLAEGLTVAEGIALGHEPRRGGLLFDRRRAYVEAALLAERFGFQVDPGARVGSLSPAERRQAELMRALARGGEVLILDEPTSLLTESETEGLFALIRRLAEAGKGVIYISHRAAEIRAVASTVTVLRAGRVVEDRPLEGLADCDLSALMAASSSCASPGGPEGPGPGPVSIEARGLVLGGGGGGSPISFAVRRGEVLGLIGLAGNGLDRLEACAAGLRRPAAGELLVEGRPAYRTGPRFREEVLSYAPSGRDERGLCLASSVADNAVVLERRSFGPAGWLGRKAREERAREIARRLGLSAGPRARAGALSGGNRQRLLLSRELDPRRPAALLCDPTQGLDVAAQAAAAARILELRRSGVAVLLLSSSLDEILLLADRIGVLYRGSLVYEAPNEGAASVASLAAWMTGLGAA